MLRQIGNGNSPRSKIDVRRLYDVPQLAHVSRPRVAEKGVKKVLVKAFNVAAETSIHLATEVIRQQNNIVLAVSERWQLNPGNVDPKIQVLSERSISNRPLNVLIRSRYDPNVDGNRFLTADAANLPRFYCSQEFRLHILTHVPNLIEEDRASVRLLEVALLSRNRPGKRPFFIPKEFAFKEGVWNGGAVDTDERLLPSRTVRMDQLGCKLLSGPGLAGDEDTDVGSSDLDKVLRHRVDR